MYLCHTTETLDSKHYELVLMYGMRLIVGVVRTTTIHCIHQKELSCCNHGNGVCMHWNVPLASMDCRKREGLPLDHSGHWPGGDATVILVLLQLLSQLV